jgi:hypothetical protein
MYYYLKLLHFYLFYMLQQRVHVGNEQYIAAAAVMMRTF